MTKQHTNSIKKYISYREALDAAGPFAYFVTCTFQVKLSADDAAQALQTIQNRVNRKLFGSRWREKDGAFLQGYAILEHASILGGCQKPSRKSKAATSTKANSACHYHMLIKPNERLSTKYGLDDCIALKRAYREAAEPLKLGRSGAKLVNNESGIDVKMVHDQKRLVGYCLKDIAKDGWSWDTNVVYLGR